MKCYSKIWNLFDNLVFGINVVKKDDNRVTTTWTDFSHIMFTGKTQKKKLSYMTKALLYCKEECKGGTCKRELF